jgi:hypothetical protein
MNMVVVKEDHGPAIIGNVLASGISLEDDRNTAGNNNILAETINKIELICLESGVSIVYTPASHCRISASHQRLCIAPSSFPSSIPSGGPSTESSSIPSSYPSSSPSSYPSSLRSKKSSTFHHWSHNYPLHSDQEFVSDSCV